MNVKRHGQSPHTAVKAASDLWCRWYVRRGATDPLSVAKAGDAVVAPKQTGAQGFYKVWVSDAPMEAE